MGISNRDGALYEATGFDTSGFKESANAVERIFQEVGATIEKSGKVTADQLAKIKSTLKDDVKAQAQAVELIKNNLRDLENTVSNIDISASSPQAIAEHNELIATIQKLRTEYDNSVSSLGEFESASGAVGEKQELIMRQIRTLKSEMAHLKIAGQENTDMYREKSEQLGVLSTAMRELKKEQELLSTGGSGISGLISGMRGLTGTLTAGAGAFGLVNAESETFAKIQTRVQSLMAISIGLQAAQDTLHRTSAFRIHTVARAKQAWTGSIRFLNTQLGISIGLSKALVATGIGLLLAAIGGLIVMLNRWRQSQQGVNEIQQRFNEISRDVARTMATQEMRIKKLMSIAADYTRNLSVRNEVIAELNRIMPDYNGHIDKEGRLIANSAEALENYLRSLQRLEKFKQLWNEEQELAGRIAANVAPENVELRRISRIAHFWAGTSAAEMEKFRQEKEKRIIAEIEAENEIYRKAIEKSQKKRAELFAEMSDSDAIDALGLREAAERRLREAEREAQEAERIRNQINNLILNAQRQLEDAQIGVMRNGMERRLAQSALEYERTKAQIKEQQAQLIELKGRNLNAQEQAGFDERIRLNEQSRAQRDEQINADFEREYTDMLRRLTDVFLNEEERRKQAIRDRWQTERDQARQMLDGGSFGDSTSAEAKERYNQIIFQINEAEQREQLNRILENVTDFKQQEQDIRERFDMLIRDEAVDGNEELIRKLEEQRDRALSQIQAQMLRESAEWEALFIDLDNLTAAQIDSMVANIRASLGNMQLNPQELRTINDQLERAEAVSLRLRTQNPFKALAEGVRLLRSENPQQALELITQSLNDINQMASAVGNSLASILGDTGNDAAAQRLKAITDIATGAVSAGKGIARLASGDIVGGVTDLARGIADVVRGISGMSDARRQQAIERIQTKIDALDDRIQNLRNSYAELGREIDNAFSTSRANLIAQQNRKLDEEYKLIQQQNAKIRQQIREEDAKKNGDSSQFDAQLQANQQRAEEIRRQMEKNQQAARDAIVGTTIMSAINDFASAYVNAWKQGENAAEASANVARRILINALKQAMMSNIQPLIERLHARIAGAMERDGRITDAEQAAIDAYVAEIDRIAGKWESAMRPHIDGLEDARRGVTGELHQKMTEGTASQLVGLWNMTAMDIRDIKNFLLGNGISSIESNTISPAEIYAMLQVMREISLNTRETADNTERIGEIADEMRGIRNELAQANKNSRNDTISRA